jgi:hypothetical protein
MEFEEVINYIDILNNLEKSKFRAKFKLSQREIDYLDSLNPGIIEKHSFELLSNKIEKCPEKDGNQTPWTGHPVFIGQHALALCCRECLRKWYHIPVRKELSFEELRFFSGLVCFWIDKEKKRFLNHLN